MKAFSLLASPQVYEDLTSSNPRIQNLIAVKKAIDIMQSGDTAKPCHIICDCTDNSRPMTHTEEILPGLFFSYNGPGIALSVKPAIDNPNHFRLLISHHFDGAIKSEKPFETAIPIPLA